MKQAHIQKIMTANRQDITYLHAVQEQLRYMKHEADVSGDTKTEYEAHDQLKKVRKEIAILADIQRALKKMMKAR